MKTIKYITKTAGYGFITAILLALLLSFTTATAHAAKAEVTENTAKTAIADNYDYYPAPPATHIETKPDRSVIKCERVERARDAWAYYPTTEYSTEERNLKGVVCTTNDPTLKPDRYDYEPIAVLKARRALSSSFAKLKLAGERLAENIRPLEIPSGIASVGPSPGSW